MLSQIEKNGFAVRNGVLSDEQIEFWCSFVAQIEGAGVSKRESVFAIRSLLDFPEIQSLARSAEVRSLITPILGDGCFCARGIFFDKTPDANWKVVWHQDLSIAVESKIETPGFGPWSEKAGAVHVQPPSEVLENMLTLRLHLDPCDAENGALRVVSGSHKGGKRDSRDVGNLAECSSPQTPATEAGGALLMRPLLWHASSPSVSPKHRRVIHLEWAAHDLPNGLNWRWRI